MGGIAENLGIESVSMKRMENYILREACRQVLELLYNEEEQSYEEHPQTEKELTHRKHDGDRYSDT